MGRINIVALTCLSVLLAPSAQAQSLRSFEGGGRLESRAMIGLTIPLGGKSARRNAEPRIDFRIDASRIDSNPPEAQAFNPLWDDRRDVRAATFSLTFEDNPKLLLNGHALTSFGVPVLRADESQEEGEEKDHKALRTVGWVALGALVFYGSVAAITAAECSGSDSDCFF